MPVDTSIFNGLLQPPKSVADYDLQAQNLKRAQLQNQTLDYQNQAAQRGAERANQLLQLSRNMPQGASDLERLASLRNAGFYDEADKLSTSLDNRAKTQAQASKDTADATSTNFKTQQARKAVFLQAIPQFTNAEDAKQFLATGVQGGHLSMDEAQQMMSRVPSDPAQFKDWQLGTLRTLLTPEQQMKFTTPDANAALQATTSTSNNDATNKAHIQAANISASTSRANNAATIAKDFKVAGIDPQTGNFVGLGDGTTGGGGGMAGMVDALGSYKIDPNTAFARMPPAAKAGVIAQVQQKYPDYDPTTYSAKRKAATDFTSGSQGNALRSFAVAGQHLDQLNGLVDALDNGNVQIINRIGNAYASQTGNPAPTNFDAAKDVVSKEVVKAIVAGGGGVAERQELAHLMDQAKSPAQLKGVIKQYRDLMGAQHDALMVQRRAAGLPDSTLPDYGGHGAAPAAAVPAAVPGFKIVGVK